MGWYERLEYRGDQDVKLFSPADSLLGTMGARDGAARLGRQ